MTIQVNRWNGDSIYTGILAKDVTNIPTQFEQYNSNNPDGYTNVVREYSNIIPQQTSTSLSLPLIIKTDLINVQDYKNHGGGEVQNFMYFKINAVYKGGSASQVKRGFALEKKTFYLIGEPVTELPQPVGSEVAEVKPSIKNKFLNEEDPLRVLLTGYNFNIGSNKNTPEYQVFFKFPNGEEKQANIISHVDKRPQITETAGFTLSNTDSTWREQEEGYEYQALSQTQENYYLTQKYFYVQNDSGIGDLLSPLNKLIATYTAIYLQDGRYKYRNGYMYEYKVYERPDKTLFKREELIGQSNVDPPQ